MDKFRKKQKENKKNFAYRLELFNITKDPYKKVSFNYSKIYTETFQIIFEHSVV